MSKIAVTIEGRTYVVEFDTLLGQGDTLAVTVDGETLAVRLNDSEWVSVAGRPYETLLDPDLRWIKTADGLHKLEIRDLEAAVSRPIIGDGRVKAPIPGLIAKIRVEAGQQVSAGEPIMVLEAMKMQNELRAPRSGVVSSIHVSEGQTVANAQLLAEIQ